PVRALTTADLSSPPPLSLLLLPLSLFLPLLSSPHPLALSPSPSALCLSLFFLSAAPSFCFFSPLGLHLCLFVCFSLPFPLPLPLPQTLSVCLLSLFCFFSI